MTGSDPSDRPDPAETEAKDTSTPAPPEQIENPPEATADAAAESIDEKRPRRILIGSQRDPAAFARQQAATKAPVVVAGGEKPKPDKAESEKPSTTPPARPEPPVEAEPPAAQTPAAEPDVAPPPIESPPEPTPSEPAVAESMAAKTPKVEAPVAEAPPEEPVAAVPSEAAPVAPAAEPQPKPEPSMDRVIPDVAARPTGSRVTVPNPRAKLSADLEDEFNAALGGASLDDLMSDSDSSTGTTLLEPESRHTGKVVAVHRDDVFLELGAREQGCVPVKQFETPPEPGTTLEVVVQKFNSEDGIYELSIPNAAVNVDDWSEIEEGMLLEARVTGHNTGGLECEVNHLRGFIPISQVDLYRVEDLVPYVDQKFTCLVTECNPQRGNLVLSRRAVLEREKEQARQQLLESLEPGQIHEGVVRRLMDFGAFVDLGGIDGLLHISQLAWGRVNHPSEVLTEGQTIKVKIEKIDKTTGKMSLAYREMLKNPWDDVAMKYPPNSVVKGKVVKLMEFGAFVELEPGVEGLVHISELSHKRIWRSSDAVSEGEEIEVMVLSVDPDAQRISLSLKQLSAPEPVKKEADDEPGALPEKPKHKGPPKPLKGGLGRGSGGEQFGLKW